VLNTEWADGGNNFLPCSWHGIAFGAEISWNLEHQGESFDERFARVHYGDDTGEISKAIKLLGQASEAILDWTPGSLWFNILYYAPGDNFARDVSLEAIRTVGENCEEALRIIKGTKRHIRKNFRDLEFIDFGAVAQLLTARKMETITSKGYTAETSKGFTSDMIDLRRWFVRLWHELYLPSELEKNVLPGWDRSICPSPTQPRNLGNNPADYSADLGLDFARSHESVIEAQ
jgi:hypothetical protein